MGIQYVANSTDCPNWILAPVGKYDLSNDTRYIVPFMTKFHKIGMLNHNGEVVIKPEYDVICNDIYSDLELLVVGQLYQYGFVKNDISVDARVRYHYGVLKANGEKLLDIKYRLVLLGINSDRITVESENRSFSVFDDNGNMVVPFKKYKKIDGFDHNLARVIGYNDQWGIINEKGEEVLPLDYDNIWNFYGRNRVSTKVVKHGVERDVRFCDINPIFKMKKE